MGENSFKPTSHEWCKSTTDKVVKLFGLRKCFLLDGIITCVQATNGYVECRTTVSDVTAETGPRYTACLDAIAVAQHNNQRINSDIWAILRACVSSESCKWILSILGALEQKETLSQKHVLLSRWPDKNICVLLQPVSCQFR